MSNRPDDPAPDNREDCRPPKGPSTDVDLSDELMTEAEAAIEKYRDDPSWGVVEVHPHESRSFVRVHLWGVPMRYALWSDTYTLSAQECERMGEWYRAALARPAPESPSEDEAEAIGKALHFEYVNGLLTPESPVKASAHDMWERLDRDQHRMWDEIDPGRRRSYTAMASRLLARLRAPDRRFPGASERRTQPCSQLPDDRSGPDRRARAPDSVEPLGSRELWMSLTRELKGYFSECALLRQEPMPESVSEIIEHYAERGLAVEPVAPPASSVEPLGYAVVVCSPNQDPYVTGTSIWRDRSYAERVAEERQLEADQGTTKNRYTVEPVGAHPVCGLEWTVGVFIETCDLARGHGGDHRNPLGARHPLYAHPDSSQEQEPGEDYDWNLIGWASDEILQVFVPSSNTPVTDALFVATSIIRRARAYPDSSQGERLREIANLGTDCSPADDPESFYRSQLQRAIGIAARGS